MNIVDVFSRTVANQLKGHLAPVLAVTWNDDESLLASCDAMGVIIVWRRDKAKQKE